MPWGKLESTFARDPKWKRLGQLLGVRRAEAAGLVACLYSWASGAAPDGNVTDLTDEELEEECLWEGVPGALVAALKNERIGVLEKTRSGVVIHRFMERAENHKAALRMRRHRERKKDDVTPPVRESQPNGDVAGDVTVTGEREEREDREEREERDRARASGFGDMLFEHAVSATDAAELIEHWQIERDARGQARVLVVPPAWVYLAKKIIAASGGLDVAKQVVSAYVQDRANPYWEKRRWVLEVLDKDFGDALVLIGATSSSGASGETFLERKMREAEAREQEAKR